MSGTAISDWQIFHSPKGLCLPPRAEGLQWREGVRALGWCGWFHRKGGLELLFKECARRVRREFKAQSKAGVEEWSWNIWDSLWEQAWPADGSEPRAPNCCGLGFGWFADASKCSHWCMSVQTMWQGGSCFSELKMAQSFLAIYEDNHSPWVGEVTEMELSTASVPNHHPHMLLAFLLCHPKYPHFCSSHNRLSRLFSTLFTLL